MSSHRRPSMADRTMSSPQALRVPPNADDSGVRGFLSSIYQTAPLTPPASPKFSRSSTDLARPPTELQTESPQSVNFRGDTGLTTGPYNAKGALICPFKVDILKDQRGKNQIFGHGAWSTVFKGTCYTTTERSSGLMTPPLSPRLSPPILVAVKKPARNDANAILESEAKIHSYLMTMHKSDKYIVPFFGIISSDSSLVLAAMPQSLDDYIRKSAIRANAAQTTLTMTRPAIGSEWTWLRLAECLVSGLAWLHEEAMVVHGDIKPGNILLRSRLVPDVEDDESSTPPFDLLYADFSSSQLLTDAVPSQNTLSAVTREYTAPELLSSKVLRDPTSTATKASDVFSLAVTLIVAATGNPMVYPGSVFQRQAMATQGWQVINHVRNGDGGLRVPRKGLVERVCERAVLKNELDRIDANTWQKLVSRSITEESTKL